MAAHPQQPALRALARRRTILVFSIFSLTCIVIWVGLSIYFSLSKTSLPANIQKQVQPLNPILDAKTLESLQNRKEFNQDQLLNFPVVREITVDETGQRVITQTTPSPSPTPSSQGTATSSATTTPSSENASASSTPIPSSTP